MIQYNDYELLYLMNEFNEEAEEIFYDKYLRLIKKRVYNFKIKSRYIDDFIQEGLYMLCVAIRTFDEKMESGFFGYFDLILQRRFIRLLSKEKRYFYDVEFKDCDVILSDAQTFEYNEYKNDFSSFEEQVLYYLRKKYRPKEISEILKCNVKSVYNCICRIKSKKKNVRIVKKKNIH